MNIKITFKNLKHTPSLDARIKEKSQRIAKFLNGKTTIKWTCHVEEGEHYAEIVLFGPKFEYHAQAHSENLYKTLDLAIDKIHKQISKKKDKWKNRMHQKNKNLECLDPENAWSDYDEDYIDDAA